MLRLHHLPSRSRTERRLARVIWIEEKLDDLEDELGKFRVEMRQACRGDGVIVAELTR